MKAISLWQPWASAIPAGLKTIETRSWPTNYRGPLAIHAAKRWTPEEREFWQSIMGNAARAHNRAAFCRIGIDTEKDLPLGHIVATCEIYDCVSTNEDPPLTHPAAKFEGDWGNYSPNRFAWLLKNIVRLQYPRPCVGRQGFFDWNAPEPLVSVSVINQQ